MALRDPLESPVHGDQLNTPGPDRATTPGPTPEAILGHRFSRPDLLREALTHRSAVGGRRPGTARGRSTGSGSNERLEFIGDRVLGLLIAEWLAERFPDEQEGELGPRLAQLVSQPVLAGIAERLGLPAILSVAPGESRAGVRRLATVLADAMEALIGALYLDAGLAPARAFVHRAWDDAMRTQGAPPKDPKTALQEWLLGRGMKLPEYVVVSRDGPPHDPVFVISVSAAGHTGSGTAGSKRGAERLAAEDLMKKLTT
jgi:ribonuclease-3